MRMPNSGKIRAGSDFLYTANSHKLEQATFRVVAMNGRDRLGRTELFIFATNTDMNPRAIRKTFRKRWRIETSYRMINMFLPVKDNIKAIFSKEALLLPCSADV